VPASNGGGDVHAASLRSLRNGRTAVACAGLACAGLAGAAQIALAPLEDRSGSSGSTSLRAAPLSGGEGHPAGALLSLPAAARAPVSSSLGASDRAYWVGAGGHPLEAVNRAQRMRLRFEPAGVLVSSGALRVRIGAATIAGRAPATATRNSAAGEAPGVHANRVSYRRGALSEWYLNGPLGLEQGFTVARTPAAQGGRTLTLSLALGGNAQARLSGDGERMRFSRAGAPALAYSGLRASDARGRSLRAWMTLDGGVLLLHVDTAGARYPVTVDPLLALSEPPLTGGEEEAGEGQFGYSVALSSDGTTALVGGPDDNGGLGAAWVFTRSGSSWSQQGPKLTPGSAEPTGSEGCTEEESIEEGEECGFGRGVALSSDGNTALIGAPRALATEGSAWVFTRSTQTGAWSVDAHIAPLVTGSGRFGRSVALSADGRTALIGSPGDRTGHGSAFVYTHPAPGFWVRSAKLLPSDGIGAGYFGRSVALSGTGTTALIGEPGANHFAGAAWVFTGAGSSWSIQQKLTGGEEIEQGRFGYSVSLSGPGNTALVGGRTDNDRQGAAWVFARSGTTWTQQGPKLSPSEEVSGREFGMSTALSANGDTALVGTAHNGEKHLGAAWLFTRSGAAWKQQGTKITPEEGFAPAWFGAGVTLSAGGTSALVGGPKTAIRTGAAWALDGISVPAPVVRSVSPASGPATGGTQVTIEGSGFAAGAAVTIGGAASQVKVVSENTITATTSATAAGSYEVVVSDASGTSTGGPSFSYEAVPEQNEAHKEEQPPVTQTTFSSGSTGVLSNIASVPGPPVLAVNGNIASVSGMVTYELPGTHTFITLTGIKQVPFGTVIDARHGRVKVTTMGPKGVLQTIEFYEGEFILTQGRNGRVVATLAGGNFAVCPTARERAHHASVSAKRRTSKRLVRKLWANGKGSYTTKGNYASGAVLGTIWLTEDRCNSTWIHVVSDRVQVTNLINGKKKTVRAGQTYKAIIRG
jgi:IPT/TIG domain/FG-GAP repeat